MIKIMITIVPTLFFALFLLLCSSSSFDNMILSVSAERIDGTPQNDNLTGTPDNDRITGYGGNDTLVGLAGSDEIDGSRGEILLVGQKMTIIL
jgi:Ca2+-binding RTX toxin-like protein